MTDQTTEIDLESLWNETDDEGTIVNQEETPPADPPANEGDDEVTGDEAGEEDEGEQTDDNGTDDEPGTPPEVDYKALYEASQNAIKTADGRARAAEARLKVNTEKLASITPPTPPAETEEDAFLQKFRTEYSDDVIKAIDLITTKKASQIIETTLAGRLAPIEQSNLDLISQAHFGAIEAAHPDVDEINASPEFEAWLDARPAHVKGAYAYVREQGTPAEVISMLNEYKGAIRPQTKTPSTVPTGRVNAATAVSRRRGTTQSAAAPDQNDLVAFWNETDD